MPTRPLSVPLTVNLTSHGTNRCRGHLPTPIAASGSRPSFARGRRAFPSLPPVMTSFPSGRKATGYTYRHVSVPNSVRNVSACHEPRSISSVLPSASSHKPMISLALLHLMRTPTGSLGSLLHYPLGPPVCQHTLLKIDKG